MAASKVNEDPADPGTLQNPYAASATVDSAHVAPSSDDTMAKWPAGLKTALMALVLAGAVTLTIFVSLSASFGNAFEFFQNGGILFYSQPASLIHVAILNLVGSFCVCFGVRVLFPHPDRVPGWIALFSLFAFAFFAATLIDEQRLVAARKAPYLAPATFFVPCAIWGMALVVATWSIKLYPMIQAKNR